MSLSKAAAALNKLFEASAESPRMSPGDKDHVGQEEGLVSADVCSESKRALSSWHPRKIYPYKPVKLSKKAFGCTDVYGKSKRNRKESSYSAPVLSATSEVKLKANPTAKQREKNAPSNSASLIEDSLAMLSLSRNSSKMHPFLEQFLNIETSTSLQIDSVNYLDLGDFSPLDPGKYKTELCRSYQVNRYCKYGTSCNYAHGLGQLRVAFRHGKYKTRNCQSYHEAGFCRYGVRCSFIHDAEEGILKCSITDREALEALHYRPMNEFHHIATITWRMFDHNSFHPPTEVHFLTPTLSRAISEGSLDQPLDSSSSSFDNRSMTNSSLPLEEIKSTISDSWLETLQGVLSSCTKDINSAHFEGESFPLLVDLDHPAQEPHSVTKPSSQNEDKSTELSDPETNQLTCHNLLEPLIEEHKPPKIALGTVWPTGNKPRKDFHKQLSLISHLAPPKHKKTSRNKRKHVVSKEDELCWHRHANRTFSTSSNAPQNSNFKLSEFLQCLKTQEGRQHLAPWILNKEKRNQLGFSFSSPKSPKELSNSITRVPLARSAKDLSKYKTELCRSYQYNKYCEYGELCLYAHGTFDLRSYPKHPLYRTKQCFSFHLKGFCLYGSRCQFLHDAEIPLLP